MAVSQPHPGDRPHGPAGIWRTLTGLFEEAWRAGRRRRRRYLLLMLLTATLAVAAGIWVSSRGPTTPLTPRGITAQLISASLPAGSSYWYLSAAGGKLIVSGGPVNASRSQQSSLLQTGHATTMKDGRAVGICESATVSPRTLGLTDVMHANCGDPALYHQRVMPLLYDVRSPTAKATGWSARLRIATANPTARDGYTLGPVLFRYEPIAGTSVEWVYGDGSLWLYGPGAAVGHDGADLLRVSTTTGRVIGRWSAPALEFPVLVTDRDGLWLAPSVDGGVPSSKIPRRQALADESIYRISPGQPTAHRIRTLGRTTVRWMAAAGHTVWLEYYRPTGTVEWLRLHGANGAVTAQRRQTQAGPQGASSAQTANLFGVGTRDGIYNLATGRAGQPEEVLWQSSALSVPRKIALVSPPNGTPTWDLSAILYRGAFYFLNPPAEPGMEDYVRTTKHHAGVIYRVRKPG